MDCPYCGEAIKDEAIVCKHCRQNLGPLRTIQERLSKIENDIADVRVAPNVRPPFATSTSLDMVLLACIASTMFLLWLVRAIGEMHVLPETVVDVCVPLAVLAPTGVAGFWLSMRTNTQLTWRYGPTAIVVGIGEAAVYQLFLPMQSPRNAVATIGVAVCFFLAGAFLADGRQIRRQEVRLSKAKKLLIDLAPVISAVSGFIGAFSKSGSVR